MTALPSLPVHLLVAGSLLTALVLSFVACFLLPGLVHWARLRRMQAALAGFGLRAPPGEFRKLFAADTRLAHLWKEYQDSLHIQREERDGHMVAIAVRSTLPAETFFNSQYVVDARLRTEFFKHLPGIFTGIGIIGTFYGLIEGLRQFQVSDNAATVRASLESLMHSVGHAFLVSASAIAAAMVVTFLEKLLLASLYSRTEEIAHAIDARFDAGAGEDYLARLVKSSEDSAAHASALKDALVRELGAVMREQAELQARSARADAANLAKTLASSLSSALSTTMTSSSLSSSIGESVSTAIASGIGQSLVAPLQSIAAALPGSPTGDAMLQAVQALNALVDKLAATGRDSTSHMTASLQSTLQSVEQQVGGMMAAFAESQQRHSADQRQREITTARHANEAMGTLSDLLAKALTEMGSASSQMARSVDALANTTAHALERMNTGADRLAASSASLAGAGEQVGGVLDKAARVTGQLVEASQAMTTSAIDVRGGLDDYRSHRDAMGLVLTELRTTVELARKEASITADVLARIQQSSERLGEAQQQTDQYLAGVSQVLGDAHQAFAIGVKKTLELANLEFHNKLSTAVGLLSSTVVELEATLGNATPQRH